MKMSLTDADQEMLQLAEAWERAIPDMAERQKQLDKYFYPDWYKDWRKENGLGVFDEIVSTLGKNAADTVEKMAAEAFSTKGDE